MSYQLLSRTGLILFSASLFSACSMSGSGQSHTVTTRSDECRVNRSSCIYEGSYEVGERDYAEEEAKRLNRAAVERLQRMR